MGPGGRGAVSSWRACGRILSVADLVYFTYPPAGAPGRPLTGTAGAYRARFVYSLRVQHVSNILERMVKLRID